MPRLRFRGTDYGSGPEPGAIPFPRPQAGPKPPANSSMSDVLGALESVSRRMEDLARALGCLGYFDDDDDRPRAA
ncbi:MAG: hypothetical protein ACYS0G_15055 [Planctomycetota bacterium]|jgi:hypothetical protein